MPGQGAETDPMYPQNPREDKELPHFYSAAVLLMLEANLGVTVIPDYFSERLSGNTRIHTAKIDEPLKGANLVAVWKKDNKSKELRQFLNL